MAQCVRCGGESHVKSGKPNDVRRYKCKDCGRSFGGKPRKFSYEDKERFLDMYMNNAGIRKAAMFVGRSSSTPVRWVRDFAANPRRLRGAEEGLGSKTPDTIEMGGIHTRIKRGDPAAGADRLFQGGR
ncbi:MAG: hypothetical protein LBK73_00370 [Treponema sp.]|jgi:transposase-like protein|nr:hypothetical protein [Treponema sp.]